MPVSQIGAQFIFKQGGLSMSSLGMVLDIASSALAAQQYCLDVTAHNIANVNTEGYSRQIPTLQGRQPVQYQGVILGLGVKTEQVTRAVDQFIENRFMQEKSNLSSSQEMEKYMQVLEGIFSENSETSISSMLSDYWNLWNDVSNNPSGASERNALYEHSVLISEQFKSLGPNLSQIQVDITNAVTVGVDRINEITSEIAQINVEIVGMEGNNNVANDLRDKRNVLVSELNEYLDIKTFEQDNHSLTIIAGRGCTLVQEDSNYELEMRGSNGDRVKWQDSGGNYVDITNYITNGKLGGWLDLRDNIISKYELDLDAMAKEFIWSVNQQHSQGVGLSLFDAAATGTYETGSSGLLDTLSYGNKIDYTKDFKMWTYDSGSTSPVPVDVDMGISTANPNYGGNFTTANTTYTIEITQGGTVNTDAVQFSWSETGGGSGTGTMAAGSTNVVIHGNTLNFTASDVLVAGNTLQINTVAGGTPAPVVMTPTGTANNISDTYTFTVVSGSSGTIGTDEITIGWSNSITSGTFTLTAADTTVTVDGMTLPFTSGYMFAGDTFTITTDANGTPTATLPSDWHWTLDSFVSQFNRQTPRVTASKTSANALTFTPVGTYSFGFSDDTVQDCGLTAALGINTFFQGSSAGNISVNNTIAGNKNNIAAAQIDNTGEFASGDNDNALAMTDLQYKAMDISQWTCDRINGNTEGTVTMTIEDYYHSMAGSIGIVSSSISRETEFNEMMVNELNTLRNSVSGVSLDEEMTNLIKYQHAYQAAAKLITISDEMLNTLISVR
jgi:flagellar hook-associated protein FlgK